MWYHTSVSFRPLMGKIPLEEIKGVFVIDPQPAILPEFPAAAVKERMCQVLTTYNHDIDEVLQYVMEGGGKMLRPRLVYLCSSLGQCEPDTVLDIAVAIELIHLASLAHDDVIDESLVRRGRPSLNHAFGNQVSVLAGDYLFAAAFNLINLHGLQEIMDSVTTTIQIMCSGEIKQLGLLYDWRISEEDYYEKSFRKTACLFASSCKVGAIAAHLPAEQVRYLEQFGLCAGYAYQIIDDVLDFVADSESLGKPSGHDLLQGNITLPVILALKNEKTRKHLCTLLQREEYDTDLLAEVMQLLVESGALKESILSSRFFLQHGLSYLDRLPRGTAVQQLRELAIYLLEGYYSQLKTWQDESEGYLYAPANETGIQPYTS